MTEQQQQAKPEVINRLDRHPVTSLTDAQIKAQEEALKADTPTFFEGFKLARDLDATSPAISRIIHTPGYEIDPNFKFTPESWARETEGIDPQYLDRFFEARNMDHFRDIRRRILTEQEAQRKISNMGWSGLGTHLLASMFDETALAATVASEGMLAPLVYGQKASRLAHIGRAALVGSATNAGLGAVVYAGNETSEAEDILYAAAMGAVMGPLAFKARNADGTIPKTPADLAVNNVMKDIDGKPLDTHHDLTPPPHQFEDPETIARAGNKLSREDRKRLEYEKKDLEYKLNAFDTQGKPDFTKKDFAKDVNAIPGKIPARKRARMAEERADEANIEARQPLLDALDRVNKQLTDDDAAREAFGTLDSWRQASLKQSLQPPPAPSSLDNSVEPRSGPSGVNPVDVSLGDSAGARRATVVPGLPHDMDVDAEIAKMADYKSGLEDLPWYLGGRAVGKALDATRFSLASIMKKSDNNVSRYVADKFLEDSVDGGEVTASLIQHTEFNQLMGKYARVRNDNYKAWKAENQANGNPLNIFADARAKEEFSQQVARVVRGEKSTSKYVNNVASEIADSNRNMLKLLKQVGVEGFEEIPESETYLMRLWDSDKFGKLNREFGEEPMIDLLAGAIKKAIPDVDEVLTGKVAKAIFNRFLVNPKGVDGSFQRLFGSEKYDDLEDFLRGLGVESREDVNAIEDFLSQVKRDITDDKKSGVPARAKRRVLLDENHSEVMKDGSGNARNVRVSELFSEDSDLLHTSYLRQMTGRYAMAKKGIKSDSDWNNLIKRLEDEGVAKHQSMDEIQKERERLHFVRDSLLGRPTGDDFKSIESNALRLIRDSNFIRIMNQSGFAQLPELGAVVAQAGFKSTLSHVPELKSILTQLKDGKLTAEHELFREIEDTIGGFGINRALHIPSARLEELGNGGHFGKKWFSPALEKLDTAQQYGKRITSDISGMAPITVNLEKLAAVGMSQKFLNMALDPTTANLKRMKALGLNEEMLGRVLAQIKENAASVDNPVTGRKLNAMNFHKWTDAEAFEAYRYAINRSVARMVQHNMLGELHPFMSTTWGKTLGQFRTFVLVGYEKQLLHNIMMGDKETLTYALVGTFLGGLAYMAQTEVNSIGRKDAKQYRAERLTPEAIGAAAFQRSGMATLIPGTVDSLLGMTGRDPMFSYRSTGLDSNFLTGNPTVSTVLKGQGALKALGGTTNPDYDFSKVDARNLSGLVWFSNAVGLRNLFEIMQHDLPSTSTGRVM